MGHYANPAAGHPPARYVAAVLTPAERARVDAAGQGCFRVLHRDSIPEAIRAVRERAVAAVLVSVHHRDGSRPDALTSLVRDFPGLPTLALVSRQDAVASEALLRFGASGCRDVIDVTSAAGWQRLRELIAQPGTASSARIQAPLFEAAPLTADGRVFFEAMIRLAPSVVTVRQLARRVHIRPSTLMSRFVRSRLPSPKSYLAGIRLLHAALLFETPGLSVADVAYRLEYSSPQSFGRHLRSMLGLTSTEFRRRFPFPVAIQRFLSLMIRPYGAVLREFHPLAGTRPAPGREMRISGGPGCSRS